MMPKTFVFENKNDHNVYVPAAPRKSDGVVRCSCTYVCKQFLDYPIDNWGRRIIPVNMPCPHITYTKLYCNGKCVVAGDVIRKATYGESRWLIKVFEKER